MGSRAKLKKKLKGLEEISHGSGASNLGKSKKRFEDLRFYLLYQLSRLDCLCDILKEQGIVPDLQIHAQVFGRMGNEENLLLLGFDPKSEEIRKKIAGFQSLVLKGKHGGE